MLAWVSYRQVLRARSTEAFSKSHLPAPGLELCRKRIQEVLCTDSRKIHQDLAVMVMTSEFCQTKLLG